MLGSFHMIFASVVVTADVRYLFVSLLEVVLLPLVEVVLVVVVLVGTLVVLMLPSNLENNLFFQISHVVRIVWINEHELIIMGHVVILIDFFLFSVHDDLDLVPLNKELRMLVLVEGRQVLMLPLLGLIGVLKELVVSDLELI